LIFSFWETNKKNVDWNHPRPKKKKNVRKQEQKGGNDKKTLTSFFLFTGNFDYIRVFLSRNRHEGRKFFSLFLTSGDRERRTQRADLKQTYKCEDNDSGPQQTNKDATKRKSQTNWVFDGSADRDSQRKKNKSKRGGGGGSASCCCCAQQMIVKDNRPKKTTKQVRESTSAIKLPIRHGLKT